MFHREICEEMVLQKSGPIGGVGKRVQIDESKFGKRKYHKGHRVEGQWVFGGIEEDSMRQFLVPVEKRDAATLIPIIKRYMLCLFLIDDLKKKHEKILFNSFASIIVRRYVECVREKNILLFQVYPAGNNNYQ